jgi:hypothetical protein
MNAAQQIATLLDAHKRSAHFPFRRWETDEACFWALHAFYGDFFRLAVGHMAAAFEDVLPPRFGALQPSLDKVLRPEPLRRVTLTPATEGGMLLMVVREADEGFEAGCRGLAGFPDRSWMSIALDVAPKRLEAVARIIGAYVEAPFLGIDEEARMGRGFIDDLGPVFERPGRRRAELSLQGDVPAYEYIRRRKARGMR